MAYKNSLIFLFLKIFVCFSSINTLNVQADETISPIAYTQASSSNLRVDKTADAQIVQKLPINTEVYMLELKGVWAYIHVSNKESVQGWLHQSLLATHPLSLDDALERYHGLPKASLKRLKWIERAAALAPKRKDVLGELIQTLQFHEEYDRANQIIRNAAYSGVKPEKQEASASNEKCPIWPSYLNENTEKCNCKDDLNNLEITLPVNTTLMSVCLADWYSNELIDLRNTRTSLDRYDDRGSIPFGSVYIKGKLQIEGKIQVEEGPAGLLWFYPEWSYTNSKSAFSKEMSTFEFLGEDHYKKAFKVNSKIMNQACMSAPATIQVSGFRVLIGDTDEAGAFPVNTIVLNVGPYRTCLGR